MRSTIVIGTAPTKSGMGLVILLTALFVCGCSINQPLAGWMKPGDDSGDSAIALLMPYEEAVSISSQTGKPVMLFFTGSDWCTWCKRLNEEVFATPEFEEWARDNVLMVEVDFPQSRDLPTEKQVLNDRLKRTYTGHLDGFPTALFVDADGRVIGKIGYEQGGPAAWIEKAESVINAPAM